MIKMPEEMMELAEADGVDIRYNPRRPEIDLENDERGTKWQTK